MVASALFGYAKPMETNSILRSLSAGQILTDSKMILPGKIPRESQQSKVCKQGNFKPRKIRATQLYIRYRGPQLLCYAPT